MYIIEKINNKNSEKIRKIYDDFKDKAFIDYKYENLPIEFDQFISNIKTKKLGALVLFKDSKPEGLLIYTAERYNIIEINVIHLIHNEQKYHKQTQLIEELQKLFNKDKNCKIISYPMLGIQENFVKDIALLNFKFVGQSITKFDFKDPVSFRVLKNAEVPDFNNYKLSIWNDKYKDQIVKLIHLAFKNTKNANFDSRFLTLEGTEEIINMVLNNQYGTFLPYQTRLLLDEDTVEGICFTTMISEDKTNIPLIAVKKHTRNRGMGKLLLKSVIGGFMQLIGEKKISLKEINATVDTDNYPAVKMYRRLGFREEYFYPHSYFKK